MELSQILGYIATTLFSVMFIPQIKKTLQTKSVDDVSAGMFVTGLVANVIALCYATMIKQPPLQIKYTIALAAISFYLVIYYKVRTKK